MNDESVLTFGKYKGKKLANVPASWLIWYDEKAIGRKDEALLAYIKENKQLLLQECEPKRPS